VKAIFKWARTSSVRYAIAMERLLYHLGDPLGVPVPVADSMPDEYRDAYLTLARPARAAR
jgi:transposase